MAKRERTIEQTIIYKAIHKRGWLGSH